MVILHASFSLGRAEYAINDDQSWSCDKEYEWALYGLQNQSADEIHQGVADYLKENGWVGNIMPMGSPTQSEFAVSFDWLDIANDVDNTGLIKIPKLFIASFQNLPPAQRKGQNLRLRWPSAAIPNDSLNRGYTPKTIHLDVSNWGDIYLKF
jgi:hypothetical protein